MAPSTPAHAVTQCEPAVSLYHVDDNSQLRRWPHNDALGGGPGWRHSLIDQSWRDPNTISGGSGVIFTITGGGSLLWHKDNKFNSVEDVMDWHPESGSPVGVGWQAFSTVIGAGNGVLYGIKPDGDLHWYRYTGSNGSWSWAPGSGRQIGIGWDAFPRVGSSNNGVLYGVTSTGLLRWYRHLDPDGGTALWDNGGYGVTVGTGWAGFTRLASFGGGVLLARNSTGTILWYRHLDPLGGAANWANSGRGKALGTGWNNGPLVADVMGCRAT
jgi:hypothetical protein